MLQTQYSREGMYHYMVLPLEGEQKAGYFTNLFQYHSVPHFLQYELREINGRQALYYRLHYRTTISAVVGHLPLTLDRLKNMVNSIIEVILTAEEYLLEPEQILWQADKVFFDADTGKLKFCYYPDAEEEHGSIRGFLSELIEAVDKKDENAVLFIMAFYDMMTEPDCSVEDLQEFTRKHTWQEQPQGSKEGDVPIKGGKTIPDHMPAGNLCGTKQGEKADKVSAAEQWIKRLLIMSTAADLILAMGLFAGAIPSGSIHMLFAGLGILIILTILYINMTKEETPDDIMQDFFENREQYAAQDPTVPSDKKEERPLAGCGETSVLTKDSFNKTEIVSEQMGRELYLEPLQKDQYPSIYIEDSSLVVGCMPEGCSYVLPARGISRMHAKLMKREDGIYLLDLNSTNGTYLNGESLESGRDYKIEEGDMISFAMSDFYVAAKLQL